MNNGLRFLWNIVHLFVWIITFEQRNDMFISNPFRLHPNWYSILYRDTTPVYSCMNIHFKKLYVSKWMESTIHLDKWVTRLRLNQNVYPYGTVRTSKQLEVGSHLPSSLDSTINWNRGLVCLIYQLLIPWIVAWIYSSGYLPSPVCPYV